MDRTAKTRGVWQRDVPKSSEGERGNKKVWRNLIALAVASFAIRTRFLGRWRMARGHERLRTICQGHGGTPFFFHLQLLFCPPIKLLFFVSLLLLLVSLIPVR